MFPRVWNLNEKLLTTLTSPSLLFTFMQIQILQMIIPWLYTYVWMFYWLLIIIYSPAIELNSPCNMCVLRRTKWTFTSLCSSVLKGQISFPDSSSDNILWHKMDTGSNPLFETKQTMDAFCNKRSGKTFGGMFYFLSLNETFYCA